MRPLLLLVALLLTCSACNSRQDAVHTHMVDWYATAARYTWGCDAMGVALSLWLERNEGAMRDDVLGLAGDLESLDADERGEVLEEVATHEKIDEGRAAIASCSQHPGVARQAAVMADILMPLIMAETAPQPSLPAEDTE